MNIVKNTFKRKKTKKHFKVDPDLDLNFYRDTYSDLSNLTDIQLYEHWEKFGKQEKRLSNIRDSKLLNFDLDFEFYTSYYSDLGNSDISTLSAAKLHWLKYGKDEKRYRTINELIEDQNLDLYKDISNIDYQSICKKNKDLSVDTKDVINLFAGKIEKPIKILPTNKENALFYKELGISCLLHHKSTNEQGSLFSARTAWRISLFFEHNTEIIEHLGNTYFDQQDYRTAQRVYEEAFEKMEIPSTSLIDNLLTCYEKLGRIQESVELLCSAKRKLPSSSALIEKLDTYINKFYYDNAGELQVNAALDNRSKLKLLTKEYSNIIYESYYNFFGSGEKPKKTHLNTKKILIVGDFHVPQCVRYRIDQKVEQLESQGKNVSTIDWLKLGESSNILALHDVVIFYRVPAVPEVLKAIAQVNTTGKASFYEIDDLLFEESYPATIETFGGYIGLDTHIELRKSMASFYAAASFCQYGIASTKLLCEKLEQLVQKKQCLLHRNGLDSQNVFRANKKPNKETVDIFYGSGTQAHNSDFIEQSLPALEVVLSKYSHARLIIAGYLQLPTNFMDRFNKQLKLIPPINNVKAYWSFLEQADINLAVLQDDEINGCKSELKWFEAACFSIPSILSSTSNYRDVIQHGKDALLASNKQEWLTALETLITQPEKGTEIAINALQRVQHEYSVASLGQSFSEKLETLLNGNTKRAKKKIALVNVFFPPQAIGGATRVVSDNFDLLQQEYGDDYDFVIFTSDDRCTTPYRLTTYQHQGVTVYRSTVLYRENMDWHPQDPEMYKLFSQFLELENPDLIHYHCVQRLTASVVEAARDIGIPYIITAHDAWWISDHQFLVDSNNKIYPEGHPDIYEDRTLPNNVSFSDSVERLMYFRELLNSAKYLLTVSEAFADIYRKNGHNQIIVNRNGISTTIDWKPKSTSYTDKVVCGHIGGMSTHKGYHLLKDAIDNIQPDNIEMLIVDHSKPEGYENKTSWGDVPVTMIGRVSQSTIVDLYQRIDVLFAPSIWPESYGLVTREATACGCWVVASDLGGIGEDVIEGETGLKVSPKLPDICQAIEKIDLTPLKFKQVVKQSNIRIVNKQVQDLLEVYK
ncbi:MAG: glycosyltransferase [Endozoicomonas sp.]|uniref:glycosyltransferase n=1 Tax=Endozoicomonas sp. TaxID=1892382 RepID=UPI003D9B96EF